jgi:hypothetical protein
MEGEVKRETSTTTVNPDKFAYAEGNQQETKRSMTV